MSLMPDFELGLWNAWILVLSFNLIVNGLGKILRARLILQHILVVAEERWCLEKYGDAFRDYMDRTPRWIGIPKSRKSD